MSEELKACPFCGKEASYCNGSGRATNLKTFWCNCQNEDCLLFLHTLTVDMWQSRPIEDELRAEIARRDEIIARLKEDADRLVVVNWDCDENNPYIVSCPYCFNYGCGKTSELAVKSFGEHYPTCPITLHRALMKELE